MGLRSVIIVTWLKLDSRYCKLPHFLLPFGHLPSKLPLILLIAFPHHFFNFPLHIKNSLTVLLIINPYGCLGISITLVFVLTLIPNLISNLSHVSALITLYIKVPTYAMTSNFRSTFVSLHVIFHENTLPIKHKYL